MKNSQVAVLCGAVLAGALIVAGDQCLAGAVADSARRGIPVRLTTPAHKPVIAVMPKAKGDPYFVSVRSGAEEAAKELGVEMIWDGPTGLDAAKQNELVENWITRKVDAIAVAVENKDGISTVLRKAREKRHQSADLGCRRRKRRARFSGESGDLGRHREYADRRRGEDPGRQRRLRHHHRRADREQSERMDSVYQKAAGKVPGPESGDDSAQR